VDNITIAELTPHLRRNIDPATKVMTDEAGQYTHLSADFAEHHTVNHREDEYVRGEAHTNTVEGYFGIFKRGINGVYHHVGKHHLHRYLSEFDFRYNARHVSDVERAELALDGTEGKRLMYRDSCGKKAEQV
jgi:hypothetical protein